MENSDSLSRRGYAIPLLEELIRTDKEITFGTLMTEIGISKRGLTMTLEDLEKDGLVSKIKIGRKSLIRITSKGITSLNEFLQKHQLYQNRAVDDMISKIIEKTVIELELRGIISEDWTKSDRDKLIEKIAKITRENFNE